LNSQSRTEFVQNASKLVPLLQSHALWHEENRRLHDDVVAALTEAGAYRMRVPARYGGLETDATTTFETISQLAQGDGSAAWNVAVNAISSWFVGLFPDAVQDEVFADPDSLVCSVLSPTAMATPVDGGVTIKGGWQFVSNALHSKWQVVLAMGPTPDGSSLWPLMAVVPMSDLGIVDDWHPYGLRGTGSVTTVADDVFVPAERVLPLIMVLQGQYASQANAGAPMFRAPLMVTGSATFTGAAIGLANAAKENFFDRLPNRKITYTKYESQREAPITHLQVAEAAMKIDEATFQATRLAEHIDTRQADEPWSVHERARARVALGRVFDLSKQAVEVLATASGGSSLYNTVPIQRILRDVQALNMHALMHPNTNYELYGRVLCGLEPNTDYL
jgi:alkylation response protein AidB-like acyl-CoA dehydrogenase